MTKKKGGSELFKYAVGTLCVLAAAVSAIFAKSSGAFEKNKVPEAENTADTTVEFLDVGQGDCTLVSSAGHYMLIDTGDRDSDDGVLNYLKESGIETLDCMLLTHPHADHIGEAADIAEQIEVKSIIMPLVPEELTPTSAVYEELLDTIEEKGIDFFQAEDDKLSLGSCEVFTYAPEEEYSSLNNYSVLVKIVHGENSFLITGDCEVQEEKEYLKRGIDLSADVLKAAHHGSDTSSSSEWLSAVLPQYTVISCGAGNKYGHPDDETYSRICKYSPKVYITAEDGGILFYSDGKGLSVKTGRKLTGE